MKAIVKTVAHQAITVLPHEWTEDIVEGMTVNISVVKPHRTLDQNALYWLFCGFCSKKLQLTPEQLHEYLKYNIMPEVKTVDLPGKTVVIRTCGSTKDLTAGEFENYIENCNSLMIDMGVDTSEFWSSYEEQKKN